VLLNDIGYDIYYSGGASKVRQPRRQSWPRTWPTSPAASEPRVGARRILGRALIGLGQLIAAEPRMATTAR
jgi:hypothetical protein